MTTTTRKFSWVTGLGERDTYGDAENSVLCGFDPSLDVDELEAERPSNAGIVDAIAERSTYELPLTPFIDWFENPTMQTLMAAIDVLLPGSTLGDDNDAQVIIYTNMMPLATAEGDEPLVPIED